MERMIFAVTLYVISTTSLAVDLIVSQDGSGDYTTIQGAVSAIASLPDTTPKFDSKDQTACFFGRGNGLSNNVYGTNTSWTQDVSVGDLIALRGTTRWYEVTQILSDTGLTISRPDESDTMSCGEYDVVQINTITINPGNYVEAIDMTDVHFLRMQGSRFREAVVITTADSDTFSLADVDTFENYPDYFVHTYENITVRNLEAGGVFELNANTSGRDTSLTINNSVITTYCCDTIYGYGKLGHLTIDNSIFTGGGDIIASGLPGDGPVKSVLIADSTIYSATSSGGISEKLAGAAIQLEVEGDARIENSRIVCNAYKGDGRCLKIFGPNQDPFIIKNTEIIAVAATSTALYIGNSSKVILDHVQIESQDVGGTDMFIENGSNVTTSCSIYDPLTIHNSGTLTDLGCSQ